MIVVTVKGRITGKGRQRAIVVHVPERDIEVHADRVELQRATVVHDPGAPRCGSHTWVETDEPVVADGLVVTP